MAHEKVDNLAKIGSLKVEASTDQEIAGLVRSGLAKLTDSKNNALSIESRFDLAHNAAHALALAALWPKGYRSESRYLVFQCLQHTVDLPNKQWRVLDQTHRKRNKAEYEGDLDVDEQLVEAMIRAADEIAMRATALIDRDSGD